MSVSRFLQAKAMPHYINKMDVPITPRVNKQGAGSIGYEMGGPMGGPPMGGSMGGSMPHIPGFMRPGTAVGRPGTSGALVPSGTVGGSFAPGGTPYYGFSAPAPMRPVHMYPGQSSRDDWEEYWRKLQEQRGRV